MMRLLFIPSLSHHALHISLWEGASLSLPIWRDQQRLNSSLTSVVFCHRILFPTKKHHSVPTPSGLSVQPSAWLNGMISTLPFSPQPCSEDIFPSGHGSVISYTTWRRLTRRETAGLFWKCKFPGVPKIGVWHALFRLVVWQLVVKWIFYDLNKTCFWDRVSPPQRKCSCVFSSAREGSWIWKTELSQELSLRYGPYFHNR